VSIRSRKRTFTLIELLVVVAIIALLVAILLPSLRKAKQKARCAVCASNLHQIGLALIEYTQDNNDWYPSDPGDGVMNMVWEYGGYGTGDPNQQVYYRPSEDRPLYKYVYPEFFQCPDDRPPLFVPSNGKTSYENTGTSYPLNGYNWDGYRTVYPKSYGRLGVLYRQTTDVTNPKLVLAGDAVMDEFWADCEPFPPGPKPPKGAGYRWHDLNEPRANLVFVDGSVELVLINATEKHCRIPSWWWWEGKGYTYSFCPTAPGERDGFAWYWPGH
jgi:prepilin-type N-terminal cleavage/methylation domain-containing protein/prepilin-type processing-associated H-X9-DG protein